jgi:hypothetical protein
MSGQQASSRALLVPVMSTAHDTAVLGQHLGDRVQDRGLVVDDLARPQ